MAEEGDEIRDGRGLNWEDKTKQVKKGLKLHLAFKCKIEETIIFTFGYEVKGQGLLVQF